MKVSIKWIAKEICKREGKKKQVDIAQVSEILKVLSDMMLDNAIWECGIPTFNPIGEELLKHAYKRFKKGKPKDHC